MTGTIHDSSRWARPLPKRWVVRYRLDGKQKFVQFATRDEAEQHLAGMQDKLQQPAPKPPCVTCGGPLTGSRKRFCSDACRHRKYRAERVVETGEFGQAAIAMIKVMARRVGASDIAEFGALWEVQEAAEQAVTGAINGLRSAAFTWDEIGAQIGMSKQAVSQWHKRRPVPAADVNETLTTDRRWQRRLHVEAGQRFGRGVVIDPEIRIPVGYTGRGDRGARLRCDCGTEYCVLLSNLLKEHSTNKSCGCYRREHPGRPPKNSGR